ncbi:putative ferric-chelate reductase 1 homolog isoform X2 [Ornithodoros turicata]|uniref:putative ferric-chelate reductase 1 homolog isoform X2 n=1 Tax=Ornithodoros turicata TaxID=34597 RepID=UPI003139A3EC
MNTFASLIMVVLSVAERVQCLSSGAPDTACADMLPNHGVAPQSGAHSYKVKGTSSGSTFSVTLEAAGGATFKGFLIRAVFRDKQDSFIPGSFTVTDATVQLRKCNDNAGAATHKNNSPKSKVEVAWQPVAGQTGFVVFIATVVKTKAEIWTKISSAPLSLQPGGESKTDKTTEATKTTPINAIAGSGDAGPKDEFECGEDEGCLSLPQDCEGSSCVAMLKFASESTGSTFNLLRRVKGSENVWVASGISHKKGMGPAHVIECLQHDTKVSTRESYNSASYKNEVEKTATPGITIQTATSADGVLRCVWQREEKTKFRELEFDLEVDKVVLSLAIGELTATKEKVQHTQRTLTSQPVDLTRPEAFKDTHPSTVLLKLHGTFMVAAWFFLATFGMTVARHYKTAWKPKQIWGLDIWFVIHRPIMVVTVLTEIIAFILIFDYLEFKIKWTVPHAFFGLVTIVTSVAQILGTLLRPGHDSPWRPLFNWLHHTFATSLFTFSIATAALATAAQGANLGRNVSYLILLFALVMLYYAVNNFLSTHTIKEPPEHRGSVGAADNVVSDDQRVVVSTSSSSPEKQRRVVILVAYLIGSGVLTVLVIICIWTAPA